MSRFTPCQGKTACRDDGARCLTCDRDFAEIERTRALIDALAEFAMQQDYENVEEFAAHVADKLAKKVRHRRETASSSQSRLAPAADMVGGIASTSSAAR
jgi:hypothetical protein